MRRQSFIRPALALVTLLVGTSLGCATVSPPRSQRATTSKPYDFQKEGAVPPVETQDVTEEADVEEMAVTDESLDVEDAVAPPDTVRREPVTTPAGTEKHTTVDGFRIQVFASQSPDLAEPARRTAQARLGAPAYVELVDGLYKVRVGDCRTREEAETLLSTCRAVYYKDAWIVESKVMASGGN